MVQNFILDLVRFGIPIYINNLFLLPKLAYKRQTVVYIMANALVVAAITGIHAWLYSSWFHQYWGGFLFFQTPLIDALGIVVFLAVFSGVQLGRDFVKHRQNLLELQKLQLLTEMENLKGQIHPHFLFNTLNNLYGLSLQVEHPVLSDSILKLSTILRYVLQQEGKEFYPLKTELEVVTHLVDLEKLRHPHPENIQLSCNGSSEEWLITPLILLPLVENSLKYGLSEPHRKGWCKLVVSVTQEGNLLLKTDNYNPPFTSRPSSTGLGLRNVQRRLQLLYPEKHKLHIDENEKRYVLNLEINLA